MKNLPKHILLYTLPLVAATGVQAVNYTGPDGGLWSDAANWSTGVVPVATDEVLFAPAENRTIDVDGDYTIKLLTDGFADGGLTLGGTGTLTIDTAVSAETNGVVNATGNSGNLFRVNGTLEINNSTGGRTVARIANGTSNIFRFNPGSNLVLTTGLTTRANGNLGVFEFNGNISGGPLFIGSGNVYFAEGHDSTELNSVVFFNGGILKITGGTVMKPNGKFQVNGSNTVVELNAANTVNGANISIAGGNSFLVDINTDQENMGSIILPGSGALTIDVDPAVTNVSFSSSYFQNWGSGSVTINGFREGVIRFGVNGAGLTREQLAVVGDGTYSLTADGYLTEESIEYWARFEIDAEGYVSLSPWIEQFAYVAAPFIWMDDAGLFYMEESVGVRGFGWVYAYELDALELILIDGTDYGYSFSLDEWVYLPFDIAAETASWLYVL